MMSWQDFIFTSGQFIFIAALFPSLFSKNKPAIQTSLLTGGVLALYAITYATLNLWFSAIMTSGTACTWFFLAYQKYKS